jgi:hypothetical protein
MERSISMKGFVRVGKKKKGPVSTIGSHADKVRKAWDSDRSGDPKTKYLNNWDVQV